VASGTTSPGAKLEVNGAISGFGIIPVGSIIAWHKSFTNTPALPDGWVECNGQVLSDADSVYNGQTIPNLNGDGRFLRGSSTSGTLQADAFQGHAHSSYARCSLYTENKYGDCIDFANAADGSVNTAAIVVSSPTTSSWGTVRMATETRPVNMSIIWIMRVK